MKRKNQKKCYRARAVILIIVFKNIYQIFRPITLLRHMLITSQYAQQMYCLINTLTTLLRRTFLLRVFKA